MSGRAAENLADFLEYGKKPLLGQLTAWAQTQAGRAGPFTIRVTTEAEGVGTQEVYREAFDGDELSPEILPNVIEAIREAIAGRHGPDPLAVVRVQAYHDGESGDPQHVARKQAISPRLQPRREGAAFTQDEFSWGVVVSQQAQINQLVAHVVTLSAHVAAQGAQATQALATVASFRAVGTTAADMTSGGPMGAVLSLLAPAAIAMVWPDVRKILEGSKDGQSTVLGLLKLFQANSTIAVQAAENAGEAGQALHDTAVLKEIEALDPIEFSWAQDEGGVVDPADLDRGGEAQSKALSVDDFVKLAETNPELVREFIQKAGPGTRSWFSNNALALMSELNK